jgi:hypothetical protein
VASILNTAPGKPIGILFKADSAALIGGLAMAISAALFRECDRLSRLAGGLVKESHKYVTQKGF